MNRREVDVLEAHLHGIRPAVFVHLERNEAARVHRIFQIGAGHAIHPGAYRIAVGDRLEVIPLAIVIRTRARRTGRKEGAIWVAILRIRQALRQCVEGRVRAMGAP